MTDTGPTMEAVLPGHHPTWTHVVLLTAYLMVTALWLLQILVKYFGPVSYTWFLVRKGSDCLDKNKSTPHEGKGDSTTVLIPDSPVTHDDKVVSRKDLNKNGSNGGHKPSDSGVSPGPPVTPVHKMLTSVLWFGMIMLYFYLCDYIKILPQDDRTYSRDTFLFLVFLLFLVASAFTVRPNQDKILNREQTEEWKGWMQVMFVWYHYFRAKEWYNWIRVYIACYVWMTGFGNFSFFWVRGDYSLWRVTKMLFRLNFLVIFVSMVTNNEYMLYYICAMHTYWFLSVYAFMAIFSSWNTVPYKMAIKFAVYAACNAAIFDIPGVSDVVFRPFVCILGFHNSTGNVLHEWSFRGGLDHWACFTGMLCAYNYPHFEKFMKYLDSSSTSRSASLEKTVIRLALGGACILAGVLWYVGFMGEEKYAYNRLHPYTSVVPILVFIVLRNLHPVLRSYHLQMFSWLGKITLETYLSQLHIYLGSSATSLQVYIRGMPLLNFSLATVIYIFLSYVLFHITTDVSNFLLPKNYRLLLRNLLGVAILIGVSCVLVVVVIYVTS